MRLRLLLLLLLIGIFTASCGYFVPEPKRSAPEVNPEEQTIEVGFQSEYVLDPTQSSKLLQASTITVTVTARDEEKTSFKVEGYAKTNLGNNKFTIEKDVPNPVLVKDFIEQLRQTGTYESDIFSLTYKNMTETGCDVFQVSNLKDFDWLKVDATLCLETKNIPDLRVEFKLYGYKINATYLLK